MEAMKMYEDDDPPTPPPTPRIRGRLPPRDIPTIRQWEQTGICNKNDKNYLWI